MPDSPLIATDPTESQFPRLAPATEPPSSRTERRDRTEELFERAADLPDGDERKTLLDEVVLLNRGVAEALANRYSGRGIDLEDLVQVASEALVQAVQRFDPAAGNDFLSFAVPTIRGGLMRHFRDQGWMVRPPRRIQELQWLITRTTSELEQELGREPTDQEVLERLEISSEEHAQALQANGCFRPTSLDQPVGEASSTTTVGDLVISSEDQDLARTEARVVLAPAVKQLSARDRRILKLRYFSDLTQDEIGEDLGVTQTQVSRLLSRILGELRADLVDDDDGEDGEALMQASG